MIIFTVVYYLVFVVDLSDPAADLQEGRTDHPPRVRKEDRNKEQSQSTAGTVDV